MSAELDAAGTVQLAADSDAILPRGFAAILVRALSGTRPEALLEMDLAALFSELCLHAASLTPSRTNGFLNMLEAVRKRVHMLTAMLPSCPCLVINRDGITPQVRGKPWSKVYSTLLSLALVTTRITNLHFRPLRLFCTFCLCWCQLAVSASASVHTPASCNWHDYCRLC